MLVSYKKLFEMCNHCGRRRLDRHTCIENDMEDGCFLIEHVFMMNDLFSLRIKKLIKM